MHETLFTFEFSKIVNMKIVKLFSFDSDNFEQLKIRILDEQFSNSI